MTITNITKSELNNTATTLKRWARKMHKGHRLYFEETVLRVHEGGATLVVSYRSSEDIEAYHEVGEAL